MKLAALLHLASRHRRALLLALGVSTLFLGLGWTRLRVETGVLDWLPRHHPGVEAFGTLLEKLPGCLNQELIWLELDPARAEKLGVDSITHPTSFFAQEELLRYLRDHLPEIRGEFGILPLLKTACGGSLPASPLQTGVLWNVLEKTEAGNIARAISSRDHRGTILSVLIEGRPLTGKSRRAGLRLLDALNAYRDDVTKRYDLFRREFLVPVGLSSGTAEMDRILRRDALSLAPLAAVFLIAVLWLLLGSWRHTAFVLGFLAVGTIWTLGFLGLRGTPLSIVTIALVPLVLGCGIDCAVLIAIEILDRRAAGLPDEQVIDSIAPSSLTAVLLTTLTTVAGLLVLAFSDSPGMSALGIHAAFGMAVLGFLSLVGIPLFLPRGGREGLLRLGPVVAAGARFVRRRRLAILPAWMLLAAVGLAVYGPPGVSLDMIGGNFPGDAPITRSTARMQEACGGAFPEIIVARGDLSSPGAMDLLSRIKKRIAASPLLGKRYYCAGVQDILMLSGSPLNLLLGTGLSSPEDIRKAARNLYTSPAWTPLAGLFIDRNLTVGTLLLLGGDMGTDVESVQKLTGELEGIIAGEVGPEDPVEIRFFGYRTLAHLFSTYSWRWIKLTACASLVVVLLLTALVLRRLRDVLIIALLMGGSSLCWLGLLQLSGIYLSVFLIFPLVFAVCIGSDYGLHLLCSFRAGAERGDPEGAGETGRRVWSTTGRAIAIAAFTDAGVFLAFSRMELVSGSQIMMAVALAVLAVFASTIILVPALIEKHEQQEHGKG